ncbi:hypothetical protein PEBR_29393 [Penicillium brasilianum]|uniref:GPI anchored protein n=1 Tax=Penicillium brasilianum TaxID=104259 RepID=A0A1S9RHU8_PENBI|nr:hypothetical protein PEBR_29393 [Penicillium brasilianum]
MKGFVGGIPIALLAAAAQAMEHGTQNTQGMQTRSHYPHVGGTALGGPSGNDGDGGFTGFATSVNTKTDVDEYSKDDHSINIKDTDVYPPVREVFGPGEGPFPKRSQYPHYGGTAIGGPSGDDEGQSFDMPFTANVKTTVDEYSKDDHSIKVKDTDVYPPPVWSPAGPPHSAHGFHGPPSGLRQAANPNVEHYHVPASAWEKRWGFEEEPEEASEEGPEEYGGTAIGGPSGNDGNYGPHGFAGPIVSGGTAIGGPSGNDGGQSFSAPISVDVTTGVHEHYEDDHSIGIQHEDVYPHPSFPIGGGPGPFIPQGGAPWRRAYSPDRVAGGGTALGGPSGDDGGISFGNPTSVGVDTNVNEHSEDNHAINVDSTHFHRPAAAAPHMPWMPYHEEAPIEHPGPVAVPEAETPKMASAPPAPPAAPIPEVHEEQSAPPSTPREDQDDNADVPQCAAQTHEVVHTVTETQYKEVHPTLTVYATPVVSQAVQTTAAVPMSATPEESYVDPKVDYSAPVAPSSSVPYQSYDYSSQRPTSSSAAYSLIPVHVPVATPSSSGAFSKATPSSSYGLPSGADALHSASASAQHSAVVFQGSAARLSGGIASVAAAVAGVLAFVL